MDTSQLTCAQAPPNPSSVRKTPARPGKVKRNAQTASVDRKEGGLPNEKWLASSCGASLSSFRWGEEHFFLFGSGLLSSDTKPRFEKKKKKKKRTKPGALRKQKCTFLHRMNISRDWTFWRLVCRVSRGWTERINRLAGWAYIVEGDIIVYRCERELD